MLGFPGVRRVSCAGNTSPPNDYQEFGLWDAIYNSGEIFIFSKRFLREEKSERKMIFLNYTLFYIYPPAVGIVLLVPLYNGWRKLLLR